MYKMVVVDDDYLVRRGIKETINWDRFDIKIVAEASNGEDALELCRVLQPDVIITDIKMPNMSGDELILALNKIGLDCAIVVLSGYKDFEYVKAALENGAFTYLLKPVSNEELQKAVLIAVEKLMVKRKHFNDIWILNKELPTLKNIIFLDLILANYNDFSEIFSKMTVCGMPVINSGVVVYIKADDGNDLPLTEISKSLSILLNIIEDKIKGRYKYLIEQYSDNIVIVIETLSIEDIKAFFNEIFAEYKSSATVTVGVSGIFENISEIKSAFHTAKNISGNKLFLGLNMVLIAADKSFAFHKDILEAMKYIAKNYSKQISVKAAADSLYVSESHLMHLFKKNVGKTFNEYLTDYRMLITKQLLADSKFKVYEIAEIVGYNDVKYFSKVFKKSFGLTPNEYSKKEGHDI